MKRLLAATVAASMLAVAQPAHAEDPDLTPVGIVGCYAEVNPPAAGFSYLFQWTIVTCDRPVYMVIWTTIRPEFFVHAGNSPPVAWGIESHYGYGYALLTRTKCQRPASIPSFFGGFFKAVTWVSATFQGETKYVTFTTLARYLPCTNGQLP